MEGKINFWFALFNDKFAYLKEKEYIYSENPRKR
jgi:hypothetical protein